MTTKNSSLSYTGQTPVVDLKMAARILGIPFVTVRRQIAQDQIQAIRSAKAELFMARDALVKLVERIK